MYPGKMTKRLKKLFDLYYARFGCDPDEYDEFDYGSDLGSYLTLVRQIKKALRENKEIPDLYPLDDDCIS